MHSNMVKILRVFWFDVLETLITLKNNLKLNQDSNYTKNLKGSGIKQMVSTIYNCSECEAMDFISDEAVSSNLGFHCSLRDNKI